jgi:hypothetical protein
VVELCSHLGPASFSWKDHAPTFDSSKKVKSEPKAVCSHLSVTVLPELQLRNVDPRMLRTETGALVHQCSVCDDVTAHDQAHCRHDEGLVPARGRDLSLHPSGFGVHPTSCSVGTRGSSTGVKRPGREALYLVPRLYTRSCSSIPPMCLGGVELIKHGAKFTFIIMVLSSSIQFSVQRVDLMAPDTTQNSIKRQENLAAH